MANTITAFLETLVAAAGDYNAATVGQLAYIDSVYKDIKPEAARPGKTIQVYYPDMGPFTDVSVTGFSDQEINPTFVNLTFNQVPGKSFTVSDFEQWQTAVEVKEKFIDPMYKRACEYLNGQISALINPTNFNVNAPIVGTTAQEVSVKDAARAWNALATAKAPVGDTENLRILTHNDCYANMLTDNAWVQENQVGAMQAESARQSGNLRKAFNAPISWDQQAPKVFAAVAGTVGVTNNSAAVTGAGTSFSTALAVGQYLIFANDPSATPYRILSIASNTALTLATVYTGTTAASTTANVQSYTSVYMHKYAIALGLRPMPVPDTNVVRYQTVYIRDIPIRVMIGYHQVPKPGYTVTMDFGFALAVVRPSFGVIVQS